VERLGHPALLAAALDRLPRLTPTVVAYYLGLLQRARATLVPLLVKRLRVGGPGLARYAEFAARLGEPGLREPLTALTGHPDAEVRIQAARALGGYPHPESVTCLTALAKDPAWPVRAQAVRSLGRLGEARALPLLRAALADPEWWVRLRAALALTRLAGPGRDALLTAEAGAAPLAREMARLILGLPAQALAEFAT
jgi:HEAT repeat protein